LHPIDFTIVGEIRQVEIVAVGPSVRDRRRLDRHHGRGRWRKMKGLAVVELKDGTQRVAEVHWYEAHVIGQREFKVKLPFVE
jgi:hypothetical protein